MLRLYNAFGDQPRGAGALLNLRFSLIPRKPFDRAKEPPAWGVPGHPKTFIYLAISSVLPVWVLMVSPALSVPGAAAAEVQCPVIQLRK